MSHEAGVVRVADYDTGNAFGAAVCVERVGCFSSLSCERRRWGEELLFSYTFLFDILPLAGLCTLRDGLAEYGHELAIAGRRGAPPGQIVS